MKKIDEEALMEEAGADPGCHHEFLPCKDGVWSEGGNESDFRYLSTVIISESYCRHCLMHRTATFFGSQRNPWEHDSVTFTTGRAAR